MRQMVGLCWVLLVACQGTVGLVDRTDRSVPTDETDLGTWDTDTDTDTDTVQRWPIADAGPDLQGFTRETIQMDGSRSYVPGGDPLNYRWTLVSGPAPSDVTLEGADSVRPRLTTRRVGDYTLELRVDDGERISLPDRVVVSVVVPYVEGELFDPEDVWLIGTTRPGACFLDIITDPLAPDSGTVAFPCSRSQQSLTDDGRLIYRFESSGPPRVFRCDGDCSLAPGEPYPRDVRPELNDPDYPHPCEDAEDVLRWVHGAGGVLYQCQAHRNSGRWFDEGAAEVLSLPPRSLPLTRSVAGDLIYRGPDTTGRLYWLDGDGGRAKPIGHDNASLRQNRVTIRAQPDGGFLIAAWEEAGEDETRVRLYALDGEGNLTTLGDYPDVPGGILPLRTGSRLDADRELWHQGRLIGAPTPTDVLVRRTLGGDSEVVYTEADEPFVKIHISELVTAP